MSARAVTTTVSGDFGEHIDAMSIRVLIRVPERPADSARCSAQHRPKVGPKSADAGGEPLSRDRCGHSSSPKPRRAVCTGGSPWLHPHPLSARPNSHFQKPMKCNTYSRVAASSFNGTWQRGRRIAWRCDAEARISRCGARRAMTTSHTWLMQRDRCAGLVNPLVQHRGVERWDQSQPASD